MKMHVRPLIQMMVIYAISFPGNAAWVKQCLDDCFSTGHECKFCSYQCFTEGDRGPRPLYFHAPCPLAGYENEFFNEGC